MNTVETQMQALLTLLEDDRRRQCDALIADAQARARTVLRQAQRDARSRMRAAFAAERQRLEQQIKAAAARLQASTGSASRSAARNCCDSLGKCCPRRCCNDGRPGPAQQMGGAGDR